MKGSTGYLREDFRLFHLRDSLAPKVDFHYHEFDKIIIFLSGAVTYMVEGRTYAPSPGDVLFVRHGDLHSLVIDPKTPYERVVLWMNTAFLDEHSNGGDLSLCFTLAHDRGGCLFHPTSRQRTAIKDLTAQLENAVNDADFGSKLMGNICFLRLIIELDRYMASAGDVREESPDRRMDEIMEYIGENLSGDLSNDTLAEKFFLNRYYLMHRFKQITGCTVQNYVRNKRLAAAAGLIAEGKKPSEAAEMAGFEDYSTFLRGFRARFGVSPRQYSLADSWQREKMLY